jgi:hypothetical protein
LKLLIAKFRQIESPLINTYIDGIKVQFVYACATSSQIQMDAEQQLSVDAFVQYGLQKKIRFNDSDIEEVMDGRKFVKFDDFLTLLVLASCGGVITKVGIGNFKNLM